MTKRKFQVGDIVEILWVPGFQGEGQEFVGEHMPGCLPFATISCDLTCNGSAFKVAEDSTEFTLWPEGLRLIKAVDATENALGCAALHPLQTMSVGSLEAEAHYLQQRLADVHKEIFTRMKMEDSDAEAW